MLIYIIRHGQTEDNVDRIVQGQSDSPLTALGVADTKKIATYFLDKEIDMIFSSTIGRAYLSAQIIANVIGVKKVIKNKGLNEIDLKPWEKMRINNLLTDKSICGYDTYKNHPEAFMPSFGESLFELQKRVINAFFKIFINYYGKNIIIVTHEVAIRAILSFLRYSTIKSDFWLDSIPPSSITELEPFKITRIGSKIL